MIADADAIAREVEGAGNVADVRGTYSMSLRIPGVPEPIPQQGKLLQISGDRAAVIIPPPIPDPATPSTA